MAYIGKTNWQNNEIVEASDMNRIEQGILDTDVGLGNVQAEVTAHTAATLQQGVHSIATTADITLYVDATNGNDNNPGTQSQPLKTIQAVINKIPQIVNHTVTINVLAGTYNERPIIYGFAGKGELKIIGGADLTTAADYVVYGFRIINISTRITIQGFKLNGGHIPSGDGGAFFDIQNVSRIQLFYCTLDGAGVTSPTYLRGIFAVFSGVSCTSLTIQNMTGNGPDTSAALYASYASEVILDNSVNGSGNEYGIYVVGGTVRKGSSINLTGTTANETIFIGGEIH